MSGEFKPPDFGPATFECRKPDCRALLIVGHNGGRRILFDAEPTYVYAPVASRRGGPSRLEDLPPGRRRVRRVPSYTPHHLTCKAQTEHRGRADYGLPKGDQDDDD